MLKSLRSRLILSHILPTLLIPIMGIILIYVLGAKFIEPTLSSDLEGIAQIMAGIVGQDAQIWNGTSSAQAMLNSVVQQNRSVRLMLIRPDGSLLASSDSQDEARLGSMLDVPDLEQVRAGQTITRTNFSTTYQGEVVDVFVPVYNQQQLLGILRLSYLYSPVAAELLRLSYWIIITLFVGLIIASLLGLLLAIQVQKPVRQATLAIHDLAHGDRRGPLVEHGPQEVKLLVRSVNTLQARIRSMEESRSRLLANLVHEMGRPLGAQRIALQALQRGAKKDPKLLDKLIPGIDETTTRLQQLLSDLTHLHDQVIGTLELNREELAIPAWLGQVLQPLKEMAHRKHLTWQDNIPTDLPPIKADPIRLAQVVSNLVGNAIKYTPVPGTVSVLAGETEDTVWIEVCDTGLGIPYDEQDKIFTPFYRGSQDRRIKQGMGLGLSIARDLILAHGGQLGFESAPGKGSRFRVSLPRNNLN
jgi:two-component system sensor histidine kinase BaeS